MYYFIYYNQIIHNNLNLKHIFSLNEVILFQMRVFTTVETYDFTKYIKKGII